MAATAARDLGQLSGPETPVAVVVDFDGDSGIEVDGAGHQEMVAVEHSLDQFAADSGGAGGGAAAGWRRRLIRNGMADEKILPYPPEGDYD